MQDPSRANSAIELRLPQDSETEVTSTVQSRYKLRYAYMRSRDSQHQRASGQDYLALKGDETRVALAVTDGVASSFFGGLAARLVGGSLLDWLWNQADIHHWEPSDVETSLHQRLAQERGEGALQVRRLDLPEGTTDLHANALEKKRRLGSATMLAGVLAQMPSHGFPHGRFLLIWLGNVRIQLLGTEGEDLTSELQTDWDGGRCWSTRKEMMRGTPGILVGDLRGIRRINVHTDGLDSSGADELRQGVRDDILSARLARLVDSPPSDDIALAEITLLDPLPPPRSAWVKRGEKPSADSLARIPEKASSRQPTPPRVTPSRPLREPSPAATSPVYRHPGPPRPSMKADSVAWHITWPSDPSVEEYEVTIDLSQLSRVLQGRDQQSSPRPGLQARIGAGARNPQGTLDWQTSDPVSLEVSQSSVPRGTGRKDNNTSSRRHALSFVTVAAVLVVLLICALAWPIIIGPGSSTTRGTRTSTTSDRVVPKPAAVRTFGPSALPTNIPSVQDMSYPKASVPAWPYQASDAQIGCSLEFELINEDPEDGTEIGAGEAFTKSWRLLNNGTCVWDKNVRIVFVKGERMGFPESQSIPLTRAGEESEIRIPLTAPSSPGSYKGDWQLVLNGKIPSHILWVEIRVKASERDDRRSVH